MDASNTFGTSAGELNPTPPNPEAFTGTPVGSSGAPDVPASENEVGPCPPNSVSSPAPGSQPAPAPSSTPAPENPVPPPAVSNPPVRSSADPGHSPDSPNQLVVPPPGEPSNAAPEKNRRRTTSPLSDIPPEGECDLFRGSMLFDQSVGTSYEQIPGDSHLPGDPLGNVPVGGNIPAGPEENDEQEEDRSADGEAMDVDDENLTDASEEDNADKDEGTVCAPRPLSEIGK